MPVGRIRKPSAQDRSLMHMMEPDTGWRPPEYFPRLASAGDKYATVDFETDGTDVYGKSRMCGIAVRTQSKKNFYFPTRHQGGGNLDQDTVIRWANDELKGLDLRFAEAKFDISIGKKDGLDFEKLGCKPKEVQFRASLLDEYRRNVDLDTLGQECLGKPKLEIDKKSLFEMPSYLVGPYAEMDVEITDEVFDYQQPLIESEGLQTVVDLEDDIIYAVLHMEGNGARLDVPKLKSWRGQLRGEFHKRVKQIADVTGLNINPNSPQDLEKLFSLLQEPFGRTAKGQGSFPDEFLRTVNQPQIINARVARNITGLESKYTEKYWKLLVNDHIRYKLHQLKGNEYGTVAGRFSSSSTNIQQVFDAKRQRKKMGRIFRELFGHDFIIRELFIPDPGMFWVRADASQIEFRLFAHYSKSEKLINAYLNNPKIDFHEIVAELMGVDRQEAKDLNFGMLYCMGRDKLAASLGLSREESDKLYEQYNQMFPEVRKLIYEAIDVAEKRGWVKTILGRRARFSRYHEEGYPPGNSNKIELLNDRYHAALNRVIQGSAADVLKLKLRELYRERVNLGIHKLRFVVHDEFDMDVERRENVVRIKEFLDRDLGLGIRVPLTWEVKNGPNWAEAA